jgi:hypothetical protein
MNRVVFAAGGVLWAWAGPERANAATKLKAEKRIKSPFGYRPCLPWYSRGEIKKET